MEKSLLITFAKYGAEKLIEENTIALESAIKERFKESNIEQIKFSIEEFNYYLSEIEKEMLEKQ